MKRSWLAIVTIAAIGLLAGVAIAGRPTSVDDTSITPATSTSVAASLPGTTSLPGSTSTAPHATTTSAPRSTTTTTSPFDPSAVRVIVANGTNRSGIASTTASRLTAAGFTNARAVDAIDAMPATVVFARDGFEEAALAVAGELGLAATIVQALPEAPVTPDDAVADIIVALGDDFPG